jgi:hypothetical protein
LDILNGGETDPKLTEKTEDGANLHKFAEEEDQCVQM